MKIGFGIIGLGMISEFHAKALQETASANLNACYSADPDKANRFSIKYKCKPYSDLHSFLKDPKIEVISICTPSGAHMEPALAAIEAGKHLIIEKPIEITKERYNRILEAAEKKEVKVAGIFPSRFMYASKIMKEAIKNNRLGRIVLGNAYVKWYRSNQYYQEGGWHGTQKLDGGGALMNQSIHAIDLLQWLIGPVIEVYGVTSTLGHSNIEVEDIGIATVKFANGAVGTIEGTTAAYPGFEKNIAIFGSKGSVISVNDQIQTWKFKNQSPKDLTIIKESKLSNSKSGGATNPADINYEGHRLQFEDMCQALESNRSPKVDGFEATKAIQIILAIYESSSIGQPVKLSGN